MFTSKPVRNLFFAASALTMVSGGLYLAEEKWSVISRLANEITPISGGEDHIIYNIQTAPWDLIPVEVNDPQDIIALESRAQREYALFMANNNIYRAELIKAAYIAALYKPRNLEGYELDMRPSEVYDFLLSLSESESALGRKLTSTKGQKDETGHYNKFGPYHYDRVIFAILLKKYGPAIYANEIDLTVDENGTATGTQPIDNEGVRARLLNLRGDPYVATLIKAAQLYETTDNFKKEMAADGHLNVKIGRRVLHAEHVGGSESALDIVRARLKEDESNNGTAHCSGDTVSSDLETAEANPSLYLDDNDNPLNDCEVFEQKAERIEDRQSEYQSRIDTLQAHFEDRDLNVFFKAFSKDTTNIELEIYNYLNQQKIRTIKPQ